jgi:transglutaminase-like putative cysteine protease
VFLIQVVGAFGREKMGKRIKTPKTIAVVALMLIVLTTSIAFNSFTTAIAEIQDTDYIIQTTVTFSNNGKTVWNLTNKEREISLFMNNTWQTVYLTESSSPIDKTEDEDGNPTATLQLPESKLEPGENVNYTVTYTVESEVRSIPNLNEQESGNLTDRRIETLREKYCKDSNVWQIDDPKIQQTAQTIAGNETKVLLIVEKFVKWMWDPNHVTYSSYEVPQYPNETLSSGKGDCDDQAILLITFCRILGIPSYLQVGGIHKYGSTEQQSSWNGTLTSVLKHIGWHGWAMVYIPPWGWLPVDLTYVTGRKDNPLNAIMTAAVMSQKTIQYMNISQRDYVTSSRKYRDFLIENQFHILQEDEMKSTSQKLWKDVVARWLQWIKDFQWFPIAVGVSLGAFIGVFSYILMVERRRVKESNKGGEKAYSSFNPRERNPCLLFTP